MINSIYNKNADSNISPYENLVPSGVSNVLIKGNVLKKDGKNIRIKSDLDNNVIFDMVTKKNLNIRQGTMLSIKKSEIETITKISDKQLEEEKQREKEEVEELKNLDLKASSENIDALKNLKNNEIPLTKENILKFATIKSELLNINTNIDLNSLAKLVNLGFDVENMSIYDLRNAIKNSNKTDFDKNLTVLNFKTDKEIDYDEARQIANEIYGSNMGKDIYDIIISLKKNDIDINKENIDYIHEMFSKLYDLKEIKNQDILKAIELDEQNISIDLLYKVKNYITNSSIISLPNKYKDEIKIPTDKDIKQMSGQIISKLKNMGFDKEEFEIASSILKNNMDLNFENVSNIKQINEDLSKVQEVLDKNIAGLLIKSGIDIPAMDIRQLLQEINAISKEMENLEKLSLNEEDMKLAQQFIGIMKELNSNTILNASVKSLLHSNNLGKDFYNKLFSNSKYSKIMSYEKAVTIKTSIILTNVKNIDFENMAYRNNHISLIDIAKNYSLFNIGQEDKNLKILKYKTDVQTDIKMSIKEHYDYLRMNMRTVHINTIVREGIDVLSSDIREIGKIIKEKNYNQNKFIKTINSLNKFNIDKISSNLVSTQSDINLKNIQKSFEIENNENNYVNMISKFIEKAKKTDIKDLKEIAYDLEKILNDNIYASKKELFKNINKIYENLKDVEKTLTDSDKEDKSILKKYLEDISKNIKETSKFTAKDEMLQIPFYMNGEGRNANVYAKTKKNKKGKIDPENMSVLIDLNTDNLGKMGFYIKTDNKKLSIKISGEKNSMQKIKSSIQLLDTNLAKLGYNIEFVDIISPTEKAKISFVEENMRTSNNNIDFFI